MDWPLIGLAACAAWIVLLVADDTAALLNVPRKILGRLRNVVFFGAVAGIVFLGVAVNAEHHTKPCTTTSKSPHR